MPVGHLYILFGEMSFQVFCPFFSWVIGFIVVESFNCLYILEIKPLSVASFETIFSLSEGYLFGIFMVSIALQKPVSLIRSHEFIFVFISIALGV